MMRTILNVKKEELYAVKKECKIKVEKLDDDLKIGLKNVSIPIKKKVNENFGR